MRAARDRPVLHSEAARPGFLLPVVLVIVTLLTLAVYLLLDRTANERTIGTALVQRRQAEMAAASAGDRMLAMSLEDPLFDPLLVASWSFPIDERAEVTLLAMAPDGGGLLPGVESEGGRLNLNTLAEVDLPEEDAALVLVAASDNRLTEDLADLILDFIDADSQTRPLGDETGLSGVPVRNLPLDTLDDLLAVPGMTPDLLYGEDANRNGLLDLSEDDGDETAPPDNADGVLDRGLAAYFTVASREATTTPDGQPRVNLNQDDLSQLEADLSAYSFTEEAITYLMIARKEGVDTSALLSTEGGGQSGAQDGGGPNGGGQGGRGDSPGGGFEGGNPLGDPFGGEGGENQPSKRLESLGDVLFPLADDAGTPSPFASDADALRLLFDVAALSDEPTVSGRLDIAAVDPVVISGLPSLDVGLAETIVSRAGEFTNIADLYNEGLLDAVQFRAVADVLTIGSSTYRFQAIGFVRGGPAVRYEFLLDVADPTEPRLLRQTDLMEVGLAVDRGLFEPAAE